MGAGRLKLAVDSTRERDYINSQISAANDSISQYQADYDQFRATTSLVTDLLPFPPEVEAIGVAGANYMYYEGHEEERDSISTHGSNLTDVGADGVTYTNVHTGEESGGPRFFKQDRKDAKADLKYGIKMHGGRHLTNRDLAKLR